MLPELARALARRLAGRLARLRPRPRFSPALLAPIAVLRQAAIYQGFLDCIEPSEHPYHRADPPERLACAAALLAAEQL